MTRTAKFVGTVAAAAGVVAAGTVGMGTASAAPTPGSQSCTATYAKPTFPFLPKSAHVVAKPSANHVTIDRQYPDYNLLSYHSHMTVSWTNHATGQTGRYQAEPRWLTHGTAMDHLTRFETGPGHVSIVVEVANTTPTLPIVTDGRCTIEVQV